MNLPTEKDINLYDSLDGITACKHFLHKTREEAVELFRDNDYYHTQDLMWMGPKAFAYYLQSAFDYLKTTEDKDLSDFIDCLHGSIWFHAEYDSKADFALAKETIVELVDYIIEHYDEYGISPEIYGNLRPKFQAFKDKLNT